MVHKVCIPIDADQYAEFVLRSGKSVDVAGWIENIVQDFLDRTELEERIWSKEHVERVHAKLEDDFESEYGDPQGFYQWDDLFLWNGTQIRMNYKGRNYYAWVRDEQIVFEEQVYTPSQLASKIAAGTSRNAWRDLWFKERGSDRWVLADDLRRQDKARRPVRLEDF